MTYIETVAKVTPWAVLYLVDRLACGGLDRRSDDPAVVVAGRLPRCSILSSSDRRRSGHGRQSDPALEVEDDGDHEGLNGHHGQAPVPGPAQAVMLLRLGELTLDPRPELFRP